MADLCIRCKSQPVEVIDDWESDYCRDCNDRMIERNNARAEWNEYHPGTPCPESELPPLTPDKSRGAS